MHRTTFRVLVAAAAILAAGTAPAQDSSRASATVKDVMTEMTIPASDVIFAAASEPPDTPERWAALRKAADTLAASGRLLMKAELARDSKTWMEMARALVSQGEATARIAETRARDRLAEASDEVYATCDACHGRYLQP